MDKLDPALFGNRRVEKVREYEYFDTPDGEDIGKKLLCVAKPAGYLALAFGTVDVMLKSKPKGVIAILSRYAYISFPIMGIATTFVITTNLLRNIRNKDDYLNWILGGFASGSVLGAYRRKMSLGLGAGAAFAFAALVKKDAVIKNWTLIPEGPIPLGTINYVRHDYSLTPYRPGNYTVGPAGSVGPEK